MDPASTGVDGSDDHESARHRDETDYTDYGNDTAVISFSEKRALDDADSEQQGMKSITLCEHEVLLQEDRHQQEPAVIGGITVINRNQCNQLHISETSLNIRDRLLYEEDQGTGTEPGKATLKKGRCPHHPRARLVRFDPAGQAWCDRLECWDCYRLMKIGEALGYRSLTERGGKLLIEEGMVAWAIYVRTQRAFLVSWVTQEALALCRVLGIQEPELSGEVKRLIEVQPLPP
jgi:hypothetical protein